MNPVGAIILLVLVGIVLTAPRRGALLGMMAGVLYLTQTQSVLVIGLNLFAVRFLELAGFARVMMRREFSFSQCNKVDKTVILLYVYTAAVYCFRATDGKAYMIGASVDAFLCYFTFRGLVYNLEDLQGFLRSFIFLLAPYALLVLVESVTHHSPFSIIGGGMYDWMRGDRFRCVGSFRNPDLLGTLGASFFALYVGLALGHTDRRLAITGCGLCLLLVWASNSGGPLCAVSCGVVAWGFWRIRMHMSGVRRAMACGIILLAIVMKAPIWYLLARVSDFTGGDGWHRAYLLDVSFQNLRTWWLAGMDLNLTADWFAYGALTSTGGADITNQFLSFGLNAGLGALALLILLLVRAFGSVGKALDHIRLDTSEDNREQELLVWGLGVMLAVHIVNWMGITYFDQIYVVWFMQLAALSSISENWSEKVLVLAEEETERQEGVILKPQDGVFNN